MVVGDYCSFRDPARKGQRRERRSADQISCLRATILKSPPPHLREAGGMVATTWEDGTTTAQTQGQTGANTGENGGQRRGGRRPHAEEMSTEAQTDGTTTSRHGADGGGPTQGRGGDRVLEGWRRPADTGECG
jgi:hypothetical protein